MERVGSEYNGGTVVEMDTTGHNTKRHHMGEPSAHVHLNHNSSSYDFFNFIISGEFRSSILQGFANMRASMEGAGRKGDNERKTYTEFTPFSQEEIDNYIGLLLANGINIMPQINLWFL